jgi:hypothetical protein
MAVENERLRQLAAVALGKLAAGKPKHYSSQELAKRTARLPKRLKKTACILTIGTLALVGSLCLSSCDSSSALSKDVVRNSILKRFARQKLPVIIENISEPQKMMLHGESLTTAVCTVEVEGQSGNLPLRQFYYFVESNDRSSFLSGFRELLMEIDTDGYKAVSDRIPTLDGPCLK